MIENDKPFDAYSLRMEEISKRVSNLREELILTLNNVTVDLIRQAINPNINPFSSSVTVKLEELKAVQKEVYTFTVDNRKIINDETKELKHDEVGASFLDGVDDELELRYNAIKQRIKNLTKIINN